MTLGICYNYCNGETDYGEDGIFLDSLISTGAELETNDERY